MRLSVIIPTCNEQENLTKRLSFLNEQTNMFPIEIIISDSPESIDESEMICKKYANVSYFLAKHKGRSFQMNYGAAKASGDVFLFLHADVILPNDFYNQILNAFNNGFKAGFFSYYFDEETFLLKMNSSFTNKDGLFAGGGDQCQFYTKNTFQELKGFNEEFCIMEDFEMIGRIRKFKIPYKIIQSRAIVSARKYHNNSWLKVNLINGYVFLKYKLGVHPIKLRSTYKSLLRERQ
jgi:rSAM/selenodomain-associated transferase 2